MSDLKVKMHQKWFWLGDPAGGAYSTEMQNCLW